MQNSSDFQFARPPVWHVSAKAFIEHACPLVLLGVFGFAAVPLISPALAMIALPLARIAITRRVATETAPAHAKQLPVSFILAWGYTAITTASFIFISVPLQAWGIHLNFLNQGVKTWSEAGQTVLLRSAETLLLTPISPFKSWLTDWRNWAFDEWVQKPNNAYEQQLMADYQRNGIDLLTAGTFSIEAEAKARRENRSDLRLMFISGIALLLVAETLFAFRALLYVNPVHLLWFSLKHFGVVAAHVWGLRFVMVGLKAAFVFVPIVVVDHFSVLAQSWGWFGSAQQAMALLMCVACIDAIASTFEVVYVAKLARSLSE